MKVIMEFLDSIAQIPAEISTGIIRFGILFIILLLTWLFRNRIAKILALPLRTVISKTSTEIDDFFVTSINKVITYIVLAIPLLVSLFILPLSEGEYRFISAVASTLLVFALTRLAYDLVSRLMVSSTRVEKITGYSIDGALMPLLRFCAKVIVVIFGVLTITQIWGWNIAGLVAGVGLGGLAISLAAKDILEDILGYGVIVVDNVLREEEYIVSPHAEGIVENIGVLSTRIRQLNQGLVIVPNSKLSGDWVVNWSRLEKRWFNFEVGLTYRSTADQIQQFVNLLTERLREREHVQEDSVVVLFTEYADSSLNVLVRFYVDLPDWVDAHAERHEVNLVIMHVLKDIGIEVAFPSRSLYLEDVPSGLLQTLPNGAERETNGKHGSKVDTSHVDEFHEGDDEAEIADKAMEERA